MIAQYIPDSGQWPLPASAPPTASNAEWVADQGCALPQRKPRPSVHVERYSQAGVPDSPTRDLERIYVIDDREVIDEFLQSNRSALPILRTAPAALDLAFGEAAIKVLRLVEDDEGTRTLFCFVAFNGHLSEAMRALKSFDENWWLDRCAQVAGKLNFDFELV